MFCRNVTHRQALCCHPFRRENFLPHSDRCQNHLVQRREFLTSYISYNRWRLMWSRIYRQPGKCLKEHRTYRMLQIYVLYIYLLWYFIKCSFKFVSKNFPTNSSVDKRQTGPILVERKNSTRNKNQLINVTCIFCVCLRASKRVVFSMATQTNYAPCLCYSLDSISLDSLTACMCN